MLCWPKHGDGWKTPVPMEEDPLLDTDMLMSEFSDTLFSTLASHQPVAWPNPREIGECRPGAVERGRALGREASDTLVPCSYSTSGQCGHDPAGPHPTAAQPGLHGHV